MRDGLKNKRLDNLNVKNKERLISLSFLYSFEVGDSNYILYKNKKQI